MWLVVVTRFARLFVPDVMCIWFGFGFVLDGVGIGGGGGGLVRTKDAGRARVRCASWFFGCAAKRVCGNIIIYRVRMCRAILWLTASRAGLCSIVVVAVVVVFVVDCRTFRPPYVCIHTHKLVLSSNIWD